MCGDREDISDDQFEIIYVHKDCEIIALMNKHKLTYRVGAVYYEFFCKQEFISEEKEIIFQEKVR